MKRVWGIRVVSLLALIALAVPGVAAADHDTVLQAVTVKVERGKLDKYLEEIEKLNAINKRLGVKGKVRVWQATVAGRASGTIVVGIEYPNMKAFADATEKFTADDEWQDVVEDLYKIREIRSISLYREITP